MSPYLPTYLPISTYLPTPTYLCLPTYINQPTFIIIPNYLWLLLIKAKTSKKSVNKIRYKIE